MQFLADENCDALMVRTLRESGYDVHYVLEHSPGAADADVLALSLSDQRLLITEDLDFCELVYRDGKPAYGILLIRISSDQRSIKAQRIIELVETYGEQLVGSLTSLSVDDIRIRLLPI